jgi:hypothetical protein
MHHADDSIEVNATPDQTWQVLSNLRRLPEWYVPAQRIQVLTSGPVKEGWQFLLAVKTLSGLVLNATGTVTEFNADTRSITWRGQAPGISGDSRWTISPAAGTQTRISHSFQGQGWLMFLSQKLGRNRMTVRKRLANLKILVEAEV